MQLNPLQIWLLFVERYGFFFLLLFIADLMLPDFSPRSALMALDLDMKTSTQTGGNIIKQLFSSILFISYGLSIFGSLSLLEFGAQFKRLAKYLIAILLITLISTTWSAHFDISIKRAIFQCMFVFISVSSVYFAMRQRTIARCINLYLVVFLIASVYSLTTGNAFLNGSMAAWLSSKNNYGALCLFTIFITCINYNLSELWVYRPPSLKDKQLFIIKQIPVIFFLMLSESKTSIALALICYFSVFVKQFPVRTFLKISSALAIFVFIVPLMFSNHFGTNYDVSQLLEWDDLTGRGQIWSLLYSVFSSPASFFYGAGYGTFFNAGDVPEVFNIKNSYLQFINSAHNGYIELALQFGIPITTGLLFIFFMTVKQLQTRTAVTACWLIFFYNITESAFLRDQHIMWFAFLVMLVADALYSDQILRNKSVNLEKV